DTAARGVVSCLKCFEIFPSRSLVLHCIVVPCPLQLGIDCSPIDAKIVSFSGHTIGFQGLVKACCPKEVLRPIQLFVHLISQSVVLPTTREPIPIALRHASLLVVPQSPTPIPLPLEVCQFCRECRHI